MQQQVIPEKRDLQMPLGNEPIFKVGQKLLNGQLIVSFFCEIRLVLYR